MVQTLTSFEVSEIPAVEVVCQCGSRFTLILPRTEIPPRVDCVSCNRRMWDSTEEHYKYLLGLVRALSGWMTLANKPFKLRCSISDKD